VVTGAHALDDVVLDQQLVGGGLGEDVGAHLLGLLGQESVELGNGGDVVAVVLEVGRHRLERKRLLLGQQVDGVLGDLAVDGPLGPRHVGEQFFHRRRAHVGAGHLVGTDDLALLDHCDRHFTELLGEFWTVLEQLQHLDCGCESGRAGADDCGADFNALVLGIGRPGDYVF